MLNIIFIKKKLSLLSNYSRKKDFELLLLILKNTKILFFSNSTAQKSLVALGKYSSRAEQIHLKYNILFGDIETKITREEILRVNYIAMVSGRNSWTFTSFSFYLDTLLLSFRNSIIYFHHFGKLMSTFLLKKLATKKSSYIGQIKIIENNKVIYEIYLPRYKIKFRDSFLLMPFSLEEIKTSTKINNCVNNCKALQKKFNAFASWIKIKFQISVVGNLTLPSLVLTIFKKYYYNKDLDPIAKNPYDVDKFIREAYHGGFQAVTKPVLLEGFCYDNNGLYAHIMKTKKFPIGKGKFIAGSAIDLTNFIGFISCEVVCYENLGFLMYNDPEKGLITPRGTWKGTYYHTEIKKALDLGYQIKFLKGYKYEREEIIFDKFINDLYGIKQVSTFSLEKATIKLLLNSFQGRLGMKVLKSSTVFETYENLKEKKFTQSFNYIKYVENGWYFANGRPVYKSLKHLYAGTISRETAVQIPAVVTAEARIFMYDFKTMPGNNSYYTNVDSLFLKNELNKYHLHPFKIGKFKLCYKVKKALFLAPGIGLIKKECGEELFLFKIKKSDRKKAFNILESIIKNKERKQHFLEIPKKNVLQRAFTSLKIRVLEKKTKFFIKLNEKNSIRNKKGLLIKFKHPLVRKRTIKHSWYKKLKKFILKFLSKFE